MTAPIVLPDGDPRELGFIPERFEQLRLRLDSYVSEGRYAGISALIARDGRIAHFSAHGYRDLENGLPMDRETIVRIYSMTRGERIGSHLNLQHFRSNRSRVFAAPEKRTVPALCSSFV
jgi:hypothetical protein